jgi:ring-1,2-phenylacetyl-CoA epoxidase subunit PaaC
LNIFERLNDHLINYTLHLADNVLILGHRNSEWCGHGPVLEQDIAITNISLDLIGQARYFYQYAAELKADGSTEDSLAYLREESEFKNCLLVEQPNGDWAKTILRQFLFSTYQQLLYQQMQKSRDEQLSVIASKSLKEVNYHLRWSSEWVIRLGDGTAESRKRMLQAVDDLWIYTGELFIAASYELLAASDGIGIDLSKIKNMWAGKVKEVFDEATLPVPGKVVQQTGGKEGKHTEQLGYILTDLQYMQRTYPGCDW